MDNFLIRTVFFLLGILSLQSLTTLPSTTVLWLAFIGLIFSIKRLAWLGCLLFGFIWAAIYAGHQLSQKLPEDREAKELMIQGRVVGLPVQYADATRFLFAVNLVDGKKLQHFPAKVRLSWYGTDQQISSGETWQFLVKLKRPHGTANPHGFDVEQWMFEQGVGATGYVRNSKVNIRLDENKPWQVGYWRESLRSFLDQALSESPHRGFIKALTLGDRSALTQQQWKVFRDTGTSHLVAISGLHIGLVTSLVFAVFQWLGVLLAGKISSPRRLAIIAGLLAAVGYAALAGFSVPTQRALVMVVVVMGALFWQRHYQPSRVIALALWAVLLMDPMAVLSVGFWLSFFAVAVISYGLLGRLAQASPLVMLAKTQVIVAIGLLPLVLYFFQQVSIISPAANIVAVPLVSILLVPLLLLSLLVSLLSETYGIFLLGYVEQVVAGLWYFLSALASYQGLQFSLYAVSKVAAGLGLLGVLLVLAPIANRLKMVCIFLFLPMFFPTKSEPLLVAEYNVTMLDVGQGLAVVVRTKGSTLVFDTGAKYSEQSDLASLVISPYLKGEGISTIDKLVISHPDNDHAGGVNTLLESFEVTALHTSDLVALQEKLSVNQFLQHCEAGQSWQWDGVDFSFLHPSEYKIFSGNDASCVLKISSINGSVLLTGDIERVAENSLLRYHRDELKSDLIIAPHHGSASSSSQRFIEAVAPNIVLYPVGYLNRYGFPKQEVLKRYRAMSVSSYNSANSGAVRVDFKRLNKPIVTKYRDSVVKYWHWVK